MAKKIKYRKLTDEEIKKFENGLKQLQEQSDDVNLDISAIQFEIDHAPLLLSMLLIEEQEKIVSLNKQLKELSADKIKGEEYIVRNDYFKYLIEKSNKEINGGLKRRIANNVETFIQNKKELEKTVYTNGIVIDNIKEKLKSGIIEVKDENKKSK